VLTDARELGSLLRVFIAATRVELCSREVWHLFGLTLGATVLVAAMRPLVWVFYFADVFAQEGSAAVAAVVTLTANQATMWFSVAARLGSGSGGASRRPYSEA
jgi:hypothetical protein